MITVVCELARYSITAWQALLDVLFHEYSSGVGWEWKGPELHMLIEDGQPKLAITLLDEKTEWVLGVDTWFFDDLVAKKVLVSYEMRGAASIRQAPEPVDPIETKYAGIEQLLDE